MSTIRIPSAEKIAAGAALCRAVQMALVKPLPGLEHYCTAASIADERPVIVEYQYGYVICGARDVRLPHAILQGGGAFVRVKPLEEDSEWHPEKVICVYGGALPLSRRGKPSRVKSAPSPKADDVDDSEQLAKDLGIL